MNPVDNRNGFDQDTIKVLVVDDLDRVRTALRNLLALKEGIEVIGEAGTGNEAIQMTEILQPDVILMDYKMPDIDGLEATKRIKESHPKISVVLLTIHNTDSLKQSAYQAGVDEFVVKGVDADLLLETIHKVHHKKLHQNE